MASALPRPSPPADELEPAAPAVEEGTVVVVSEGAEGDKQVDERYGPSSGISSSVYGNQQNAASSYVSSVQQQQSNGGYISNSNNGGGYGNTGSSPYNNLPAVGLGGTSQNSGYYGTGSGIQQQSLGAIGSGYNYGSGSGINQQQSTGFIIPSDSHQQLNGGGGYLGGSGFSNSNNAIITNSAGQNSAAYGGGSQGSSYGGGSGYQQSGGIAAGINHQQTAIGGAVGYGQGQQQQYGGGSTGFVASSPNSNYGPNFSGGVGYNQQQPIGAVGIGSNIEYGHSSSSQNTASFSSSNQNSDYYSQQNSAAVLGANGAGYGQQQIGWREGEKNGTLTDSTETSQSTGVSIAPAVIDAAVDEKLSF